MATNRHKTIRPPAGGEGTGKSATDAHGKVKSERDVAGEVNAASDAQGKGNPAKDAQGKGTPAKDARREAEKDIDNDPDLAEGSPADDLDEGELAQRDNSDEGAFDALERKRPRGEPGGNAAHTPQR